MTQPSAGEISDRLDEMIRGIINTSYHGDNWHAELREDILAVVKLALDSQRLSAGLQEDSEKFIRSALRVGYLTPDNVSMKWYVGARKFATSDDAIDALLRERRAAPQDVPPLAAVCNNSQCSLYGKDLRVVEDVPLVVPPKGTPPGCKFFEGKCPPGKCDHWTCDAEQGASSAANPAETLTDADLTGKLAVCSRGRVGRIEGRKTLPWGESWVGTGIDGTQWASRNPTVIGEADAGYIEQLRARAVHSEQARQGISGTATRDER